MRTLQMLRKKYPKLKIGLTFNIASSEYAEVVNVLYRLGYIDGVMFMGISPGVLGTDSFSSEVGFRISLMHKFYPELKVFIDGSVKFDTVKNYKDYGAAVCVSGSSMMFKEDDTTTGMNRQEIISHNIERINNLIK